jgi:DNA-binding CsgD family transcriptional regulator
VDDHSEDGLKAKRRTYLSSDARQADGLSVAARHRRVAAMVGAGLSTKRIASELKMGEPAVKKVISRKIKYNVDGLRDLMLEARELQAPLAIKVANDALLAMERALADPKCPANHSAAAFREIHNALRYFAPEAVVEEQRKSGPSIDSSDPEQLRQLFRAMRGEDEPKKALTAAPDSAPPVSR